MVDVVDTYERSMRDILDFCYNGEDALEYRRNCANCFEAIRDILNTKAPSINKNKFLNIVRELYKCSYTDVENIIEELINCNDESVSIKSCVKKTDENISKDYAKVIEFAIQRRLFNACISYIFLNSVDVKSNSDCYIIKANFTKKNK